MSEKLLQVNNLRVSFITGEQEFEAVKVAYEKFWEEEE